MKTSRLWIFSDLHLTSSQDPLFRPFMNALKQAQDEHDTIVLAGDIFELFVGNSSYFYNQFFEFFETLKRLSDLGVQLFYIEGNHDFHLKNNFKDTSIHFEEEGVEVALTSSASATKRIWISHGDLIDRSDVSYLRLRSIFRSRWVKFLTVITPAFVIQAVAKALARSAELKKKDLPENWHPSKLSRLRNVFRSYALDKHQQGFDVVVLGHCHDLDQVEPYYWNMGYPPVHQQFLFIDASLHQMQRQFFGKVSIDNN